MPDRRPGLVTFPNTRPTEPLVSRDLLYGQCGPSGGETQVSAADTPPAKQPPDSLGYMFSYDPPGGKHDTIGSWIPPRLNPWANTFMRFVPTDDPAEAEHWRAELAAGRFPIDIKNER